MLQDNEHEHQSESTAEKKKEGYCENPDPITKQRRECNNLQRAFQTRPQYRRKNVQKVPPRTIQVKASVF